MPGQRRGSGSRSRRSWLPVLAGVGAIVLVAGIAAVTYVVMFHSPSSPARVVALPTKVASTDTVGLAGFASGPGVRPGELVQLLAQQSSTGFFNVSAAEDASGQQHWSADLMSDKSYIFIYLPTGMCLSEVGPAARPALGVRHCVAASAQQRWHRISTSVVEAGHNFFEFSNVADGKCISQTGIAAGLPGSAGLASCDTSTHPASELLAFWWTTIQ